jgi:two-component system, OmpR family, alkaline phosphatase synthesis response regulator PhoP
MPKKILVIDDEEHLTSLVEAYLVKEGYQVLVSHDGQDGLQLATKENPDLIILDVMMPEMDGYDFLRQYRRENQNPVILLTAKVEENERVIGLELGADDYITKPFYPRELMARVKAVLRRENKKQMNNKVFQVSDVILDYEAHSVRAGREFINLTPSEFEILAVLMSVPGRVFSRMDLLDALQGVRYEGYERTIDLHIKNLRAKLEKRNGNSKRYIETVYAVGYRFARG